MLAVAPAMEVGYVFSGASAVGSVSSSTMRRVPLWDAGGQHIAAQVHDPGRQLLDSGCCRS